MKKKYFVIIIFFCLFFNITIVNATTLSEANYFINTIKEYNDAVNIVNESTIDFSNIKIACIGDSITAGANSGNGENNITYEDVIKNRLNAKEVLNFGIGGCTIGDYWSDPICLRYNQIPKDTDIIIVFGGINDVFCCDEELFGNLEDRKENTFCGDLNRLMKGLYEEYSNSKVIFITPMETVLWEQLKYDGEHDYILDQDKYINTINILAKEYKFDVIDLFNRKILSTYNDSITTFYVNDTVHPNNSGYNILGTIIAKEIILFCK